MKKALYIFAQCTWGCLQTLVGFAVFLVNIRNPHYFYHGAVVTEWRMASSVSLGLFVFVTREMYFYDKVKHACPTREDALRRLRVHEYGHTIQSLLLGPLYLFVIGIPSSVWCFLPSLVNMRKNDGVSYFSFYTERGANFWGEKVTGEKSMEQLVID